MPIPVVWSEREYPHYRDCAWSMVLDTLVYGGFNEFPLGEYSNAEREALERAGSHIPETGTKIAEVHENLKNRYSLDIPDATTPLSVLLNQTGIGIGLFGVNGNLPTGDRWRRWDPAFTGIHAVSVYPLGNGESRVLDPEAPMGYQGDDVPNAKILQWHGNRPECIVVKENQFAKTFLGYRVHVHKGSYNLYHVERFTHRLVSKRVVSFSRDSGAPVWHGIPGFWETSDGPLYGYYYVYGHTGSTFEITKRYRLGNGKVIDEPVNAAS